jgi:hypothetical protein
MTVPIKAPTDIYQDVPGLPGTRRLLYKAGDYVREADAEVLGLTSKAKASPPADKAKRGPREPSKRKTRASRDKALTEPKEE